MPWPKYGFTTVHIRRQIVIEGTKVTYKIVYFLDGAVAMRAHKRDTRRRRHEHNNANGREICIRAHVSIYILCIYHCNAVCYYVYTCLYGRRASNGFLFLPATQVFSSGERVVRVGMGARVFFSPLGRDNCRLNYYYFNPLRAAPTQTVIPYYTLVERAHILPITRSKVLATRCTYIYTCRDI